MSLKKYRTKRKSGTPEPSGAKVKASADKLSFVVQRHDARRLHFDFRLEVHGVLKSWAVPKGPSMDPTDKRLAVEVEDHPLEYGKFEGTIPQGHYGAGTVEIWDKGTIEVEDCKTKKETEESLQKQYKNGEIKFILHGKKLKGSFVLVRLKKEEKQPQWLLIKHREVPKESIKSSSKQKESLQKAPKAKMPTDVTPMLATLNDKPFDNTDWLFEIKWDGFRAIAEISSDGIKLYSRNLLSFAERFPEIIKDLQKLKKLNLILDGEIVILDEKGVSHFQNLQNSMRKKPDASKLRYCVFDLLYLKDRDLRSLPLIERKKLLKEVLEKADLKFVDFSDHIEEKGVEFFKEAQKYKLEGIMAKEANSPYVSKRSRHWLKIKTHCQQEVVIGGFTAPRRSRKNFGALVVGVFDKNELKYVGHVGGGFDTKGLENLYAKMKPLITEKCPFNVKPTVNMPVTWVKPKLVCQVAFQEWTDEGIMRQPIFQGFREDKNSTEVHKEEPESTPVPTKKAKPKAKVKAEDKLPIVKEDFISNPDKIYWPEAEYTKQDLLNYYASVSKFMLPHLKERPIVMHRFPNGIDGEDFYQKDASEHTPKWVETVNVHHAHKDVHYLLAKDKRSLLYIANLGSIEIHTFLSRAQSLEYPDYAVLDLDPRGNPFSVLIDIARYLHEILTKAKIPAYCKTSGKKGLHVYIPTGGNYNYDFTHGFTQLISQILSEAFPKQTTVKRDPDMNQKKVYLDSLQNAMTKTVVAPYSVRPTPEATVSTPLKWTEIKNGLDPRDFTIKTIGKRLGKVGDLFEPLLKTKSIDMATWLKKLEKMFPGNT